MNGSQLKHQHIDEYQCFLCIPIVYIAIILVCISYSHYGGNTDLELSMYTYN